jgi:hypothetical protein
MLLSQISVPNGWKILNNPDGTGACSGVWTQGSTSRTLRFLVYFSDVESFCAQVAGVPQQFGTGPLSLVTQQSPLVYPWNSKLYAQGIAFDAATVDQHLTTINDANPFTKAVVTVTFASFPYNVGDGSSPWLQVNVKGSTEFLTIPGMAYAFSSGEKIEQDIGRLIGLQTYSITRYQIPSLDAWLALANPLLGYVNSDVVLVGATPHAPGTILFPTQDCSSQATITGSPQSEATFQLSYRSIGWNSGVRSDGMVDTITPTPYPTTALSGLLR